MSELEQRVLYLEQQNMLLWRQLESIFEKIEAFAQQNRLSSSRLESISGKIQAFDKTKDQSSITMGLFQQWYSENARPYHIKGNME
jgi:hypothetical protein